MSTTYYKRSLSNDDGKQRETESDKSGLAKCFQAIVHVILLI
jgi:hypothetical protein